MVSYKCYNILPCSYGECVGETDNMLPSVSGYLSAGNSNHLNTSRKKIVMLVSSLAITHHDKICMSLFLPVSSNLPTYCLLSQYKLHSCENISILLILEMQ